MKTIRDRMHKDIEFPKLDDSKKSIGNSEVKSSPKKYDPHLGCDQYPNCDQVYCDLDEVNNHE